MNDNRKDIPFQPEDFLEEDPLLLDESVSNMPELTLDTSPVLDTVFLTSQEIPEEASALPDSRTDIPELILSEKEEPYDAPDEETFPDEPPLPSLMDDELMMEEDLLAEGFFDQEDSLPECEPEDSEKSPADDSISQDSLPVLPEPESGLSIDDALFPVVTLEDPTPDLPAAEDEGSAAEELFPIVTVEDPFSGLTEEEVNEFLSEEKEPDASPWDAPEESNEVFMAPAKEMNAPRKNTDIPRRSPPRKGRPKRRKGYGLLGLPHLAATLVWLAIIVAIGTSLGRMIWVCAADVLAFGRTSSQVSVTITSNDTMDDIARKLHEANLVKYPGLFKLYASIAVDDGDILPGTFQMDTLYDYHALVVQMGPKSSNRSVVEDVLIPEGLNCRQIFELLEELEICTVKELEEYAANGEFSDFWFLEGVERGDKYCLEGFLFPDTYDFYAHSTPREALGKMLLGFEAKFTQEIYDQLPVLNERLSGMMRSKGCSEEHIAANQLDLRDLLIVASLIEEETASSKESPLIASVIFNRLTEDQVYERYLGIDAALIYATGDANNIDHSIDSPYNTRIHAGLPPTPISNPGMSSILAALNFEDSNYYYYVLNPETQMHQFSRTLEEHEQYIAQFYPGNEG